MSAQFLSSILVVVALLSSSAAAFQVGRSPPTPTTTATQLEAVSRREAMAATASAAILAGLPIEVLADSAAPAAKPEKKLAAKFFFNGVFRDMKHPEGFRVVAGAINKKGSVCMLDSMDDKAFEVPMMAKKDENTGVVTVDMDLSQYRPEYPKSVVATVKKNGNLEFPDGNIWKKEKGVVGVYIDGFAPYPKYRRVVLPGKEGNLVGVTMVSGKTNFDVSGIDMGKQGLQVDFPGNKQCTGKVNLKQGTITWIDGNVWTKV